MSKMRIKDNYNRPIISLRISITNRCDLNCLYCHHDGMNSSKNEMTPDEIYKICEIAKSLGVERIRISGGEPLIRKDIIEIIEKIANLNFRDISITTNGTLLKKYASKLKKAGCNRVNVSFDSVKEDTYKFITQKNKAKIVKEGIIEANNVGLNPVKINMVLLKNINQNEVFEMFDFCRENKIILQVIELINSENCENNNFNKKYHCSLNSLEEELTKLASEIKTRKYMQGRKKYFIENGEIEIVKPVQNKNFCKDCSRLRLTPDGKIKPCLLRNDNLVDILTPIRNNKSNKLLKSIFMKGIANREPFNK